MSTPASTREAAAVNAVARESLRRIAQERISPTPEAYARIYRETALTHPDHPPLPPMPGAVEGRGAASLIARLVAQVDAHHAGITVTRKREGLKRALVPRAEPVEALFARLDRLMDSWNGPNAETGHHVEAFLGTDLFKQGDDPDASGGAVQEHPAPTPISRVARSNELPERVISLRLAGLLAMLLKNIAELTPDAGSVGNQIEQIGRVLTAPLTERKLDEAERCLRALIVRQGTIKHSLAETKRAVRDLAAILLERVSMLVTSTGTYSHKMDDMVERIADAQDLAQLSNLTQILVADARLMSAQVATEHSMLIEAQSRAQALQERTSALETELREASALVRTDPLTRAMNRRGFNDAYTAEVSRARGGAMPAIALLDVDNFKLVNERYGHSVGDEVLCHLVEVLHRCAEPAYTVARYGGEEFVLMMPGASLDDARRALVRMQGMLAEQTPSDQARHPSITFSAGIATVEGGEPLAQVITRADRALREAKQSGKNRIVSAVPSVASGA